MSMEMRSDDHAIPEARLLFFVVHGRVLVRFPRVHLAMPSQVRHDGEVTTATAHAARKG